MSARDIIVCTIVNEKAGFAIECLRNFGQINACVDFFNDGSH